MGNGIKKATIIFLACLMLSPLKASDNGMSGPSGIAGAGRHHVLSPGTSDTATTPLIVLGAWIHRSFIIQHTSKLKEEVTRSHPWCIEADWNWHLRKKEVWEYCFCYPRTGFALRITNFDNPDVLGSAISLYPFIEPHIRPEKPLSFAIRFGIGPAYLTRVYDKETNPDNLFFSSPVSFIALLHFSSCYRLSNALGLRISAGFNHISNAGYSEPNLGINFPSLSAGLEYHPLPPAFPSWEKVTGPDPVAKKYRFDAAAAFSAKPVTEGKDELRYPVTGLNLNFSRTVGRVWALSAGLEWVGDRSLKEKFIRNNIIDAHGNHPDFNRAGFLAGIEWLFGRFVFYQQAGCYIYAPYREKGFLYQRYGLNFRISEHFFAGINIKAEGQDADYMDLRLGFSL